MAVAVSTQEISPLPIGHKVGPYLVEAAIGRGSTAVVYRARHAFLDRLVALKLMPPEEEETVTERFLDEARVLSKLSHPGLVRIFDCGVLPQGGAFLTMELLEGELLAKRMQRMARLPLAELVEIIRQLADALEVVHDAGLVHRDIKPSNIFLVKDGDALQVKLLDFGVAKQLDRRRTLPGMLLGTPYYMSPEQCRGDVNIDRRADVYAMGALLFHMAAARPPFDRDTLPQVMEGHLLHSPPPLGTIAPELPPVVGEVVARALAKAPDDRFSCALAMAKALSAAAPRTAPMQAQKPFDPNKTIPHKAVAAVLPRPTRPMMRAQRQRSRGRQIAVAAGIVVAVSCALVLLFWKLGRPESPPPQPPPPAPVEAHPAPPEIHAPPVVEVIRPQAPPPPRRHHVVAAAPVSPEPVAASPHPRASLLDPFDGQ